MSEFGHSRMTTLTVTGNIKKELSNGTLITIVDDDGAVTADIIATPGSISNTELADLTRGSIKVGGVANAVTDRDAKTSGNILVGDGTDLLSVALSGDATLAASGAITVAADAITNTKLANMTRGTVKIGGTADAPTDLDAKTSGNILVGDGTDLDSVAMSGDATLASTGAITVAADAITNTKLADMTVGTVKIGGAANVPTDLAVGTSGQFLTSNGAGAAVTWTSLDTADAVTIYNETGSTYTKGTLVNLGGFSGTAGITVTKADADANIPATHVVTADILTLASGTVEGVKTIAGFDTSLRIIGDLLYLSGTVGDFTASAPTGADQLQQVVGIVKTVHATTGEIVFIPGSHQAKKLGTSFIQDGSIGNTQVGSAAAIDYSKLATLTSGNVLVGSAGNVATSVAMSGDATIVASGALTIANSAVTTAKINANAVTAPKLNLTVAAHLGSPTASSLNKIVTVANLVNGVQTIAAQPDCPRNLTVTIVDTTPGITVGTVTIDGTGTDGTLISEIFNCAAGAGTYTGTKIFGNVSAVTTADFSVLGGGGDETIRVGVGNLIGLPSNIQANSAVKLIYIGGAVPAAVSYTNGTNLSSVSPYTSVAGDLYDGVKQLVVFYNVGQ